MVRLDIWEFMSGKRLFSDCEGGRIWDNGGSAA